jgi:hypothetical protein
LELVVDVKRRWGILFEAPEDNANHTPIHLPLLESITFNFQEGSLVEELHNCSVLRNIFNNDQVRFIFPPGVQVFEGLPELV